MRILVVTFALVMFGLIWGPASAAPSRSCAEVNPLCVPVADDEILKACVTAQNCGGMYGSCSDKCRSRFKPDDPVLQNCIDDCQPAFGKCIKKAENYCRNKK